MNEFEARAAALVSGWHGWYSIRHDRQVSEEELAAIRATVTALLQHLGFGEPGMKWVLTIWSLSIQSAAPVNIRLLEDVAHKVGISSDRSSRAWVDRMKAQCRERQPIIRLAQSPMRALQAA